MAFNKVILVGNLCDNPVLRTTPSGVSVATFCIAVGRNKKVDGQPEADFINIVAWRGTAEFVSKYFTKGKGILVCGRLQIRQYTASDGAKRSVAEVIADDVSFIGSKGDGDDTPVVKSPTGDKEVVRADFSGGNFEELADGDRLPF